MDANRVKLWESLRADARARDAQIEAKLSVLESVALSSDEASMPRFEAIRDEVGGLLREMSGVVLSMSDATAQMQPSQEATSMVKHTQRFEEVIAEKNRLVVRLEQEARKRRERALLLHRVHNEISGFNESSDMRSLAAERDTLRHTQRRTQELIEIADQAKLRLQHQRGLFGGITDKVGTVYEKVPFIGHILKRIDSKRRRDVVVLACVISTCLILVFIFW